MSAKVWYLPYFEGVFLTRMIRMFANADARMVFMLHTIYVCICTCFLNSFQLQHHGGQEVIFIPSPHTFFFFIIYIPHIFDFSISLLPLCFRYFPQCHNDPTLPYQPQNERKGGSVFDHIIAQISHPHRITKKQTYMASSDFAHQ